MSLPESAYAEGKAMGLTREQVDSFADLAQDRYGKMMPAFLKVYDKDRRLVDFKPTRAHLKMARNKTRMLFCVKPRQVWVTTFGQSETFIDCTLGAGVKALFLNLNASVTHDVFGRVKDFIKHHPAKGLMPKIESDTGNRIEWANGATFEAKTVNNEGGPGYASGIGRSCTVQRVHVTEAGYMNHYRDFMNGLGESLPANGYAIIESTGNGAQGGFWEDCTEIFEKGIPIEPNVWRLGSKTLVFIAWWEHDEYTLATDPLPEFEDQLTDTHQKLLEETEAEHRREMDRDESLSEEFKTHAIYWRRMKLFEKNFLTSPEAAIAITDQEYPANLSHAFQASGSAYLSLSLTNDRFEEARKFNREKGFPLHCEILNIKGEVVVYPGKGDCLMWDAPYDPTLEQWENRYCIGSDVGLGNADSDPDVIWVKDRVFNRYVFVLHARLGPAEHARKLIDIGKFYHNAHISFENNNHGAGVQIKLWEFGYQNVYKYDESAEGYRGYGFQTNETTRNIGLNYLKTVYENRSRPLLCHYENFYSECRTFRSPPGRTPTGQPKKPVAASGKTDDLIMAMMICEARDASLPAPQRVYNGVSHEPGTLGYLKQLAMSGGNGGGLSNVL